MSRCRRSSAIRGSATRSTANRVQWSEAESYSFAWLRCNAAGDGCAPIPGATTANYTIDAADASLSIRFEVTAHNKDGSTSANSVAVTVKPPSENSNSVPVDELTATARPSADPVGEVLAEPIRQPGRQVDRRRSR